ncbi:hypothetical protein D4M78_28270 [Klebsiella variicola]|nr:hypothetical protein D4M78_28270 [Klebsiella variicola]
MKVLFPEWIVFCTASSGQRAAAAAGFKNAGGNLKIKPHTPRKFADFTERGFFRSGFASSPWPLSDG